MFVLFGLFVCLFVFPSRIFLVSRWLSKTGAVVEQNLRRVRCWSGDLVYRGTARAALFEGRGELATRDGLYTGQFHLGKRNGKGTQVGKGSSYRGQWLDDFYEGRGVLHYSREHDAFKVSRERVLLFIDLFFFLRFSV